MLLSPSSFSPATLIKMPLIYFICGVYMCVCVACGEHTVCMSMWYMYCVCVYCMWCAHSVCVYLCGMCVVCVCVACTYVYKCMCPFQGVKTESNRSQRKTQSVFLCHSLSLIALRQGLLRSQKLTILPRLAD